MPKPVLVVMAAGMGSRYGGLKQIQAVGPNGQTLMDYALYDAKRAGFSEAVFIISRDMESQGFAELLKDRVGGALDTQCVVQALDDVPEGFAPPQGRTKPWGTGHAVRACRGLVRAPFAVINADDYYGPSSLQAIYDFLSDLGDTEENRYAMVGFALSKTLSESGRVSRGICSTDARGCLTEIHERTHIISTIDGALYTEDGEVYHKLPEEAVASMNLWGFPAAFLSEVDERFTAFLGRLGTGDAALRAEYFLPEVIGAMLSEKRITAFVLPCKEQWYGVTYKKDLPVVAEAIERMTAQGLYPPILWQEGPARGAPVNC